MRRGEIADAINRTHRNPGYFPDVELPHTVSATTDPAAALDGADVLVLSLPTQCLHASLAAWAPHIRPHTVIVSLMKGIEIGSGPRASQAITEVTGIGADRVAVLSGPNLAREITSGQPAAATIACPDEATAHRVQRACHTPHFRPYSSTDVTGCELGGAVKNVSALAVGIASGMGLGHTRRPCSAGRTRGADVARVRWVCAPLPGGRRCLRCVAWACGVSVAFLAWWCSG